MRKQALARDEYCCVFCGKDVSAKGRARVDHIKAVKEYPELAFDLDNLRTLCASCDNKRHSEKGGAKIAYDDQGYPLDINHPWRQK